MGVNKVNLANGETIVDLTNDSVTPETLAEGETAHNSQGEEITGTMRSGGDMFKSTYDTDSDGKVDSANDSDKLGGQLPSYYAKAEHSHTTDDIDDFEYNITGYNILLTLKQTGIFPDGVCGSDGVIKPSITKMLVHGAEDKFEELYNPKGYDLFWVIRLLGSGKTMYFPFVATEDVTPINGNLELKIRWFEGSDEETFDVPVVVPSALPLRAGRGYMLGVSVLAFEEAEAPEAAIIGLDPPIDTIPTANSTNLLTSGAIYTALQDIKTKDLLEYAKKSEIPTIPTKVSAFDNDAGYLTKHQSLENYPTKQEVAEGLNKKQDSLNRFVESVNGYSGQVSLSAGDVHALPDSTVIPTVPSVVSAFVNDADYATKTYVSEVAAGKCKAYTFSTVDELDLWLGNEENTSKLNNGDVFYIRAVGVPDYWWDGETQSKQILETTKVDLTDYAKSTDIPTKVSQLNNDAKYTTEAEVDTKLSGKQDKLTSFVSSVNGKSGAVSLNASDVGALPEDTVIPTVPTKVSAFQNDVGYLTQHQDLSAYAKKSDIPTVPTALSQLNQDATHRVVTDTEKASWNAKSNFSGKYADLEGKPTIPTVPTKVSAFENDKGYLTQHQDLSSYAKKTDIPTVPNKLSQLSNDKEFLSKTEVQALISALETKIANEYLGGYKWQVGESSNTGKSGYVTVKKP